MSSPRNIIVILVIAIGMNLLLTSCSFIANFFMLNTTDKEVIAIIKFDGPIAEYIKDSSSIKLKYAENLLNINKNTEEKMNLRLPFLEIDSVTLSISLPPRSTILVGTTLNRPLAADSISIIKESLATHYSLQDINRKTKRSGGFFSQLNGSFRIE